MGSFINASPLEVKLSFYKGSGHGIFDLALQVIQAALFVKQLPLLLPRQR